MKSAKLNEMEYGRGQEKFLITRSIDVLTAKNAEPAGKLPHSEVHSCISILKHV
jgi:hypothetical protein